MATIGTYQSVTLKETSDKNLDHMGYKVWIPMTVTSSVAASGSQSLPEKQCPHFKNEEEARTYIDFCKDALSSADGTAVLTNTITHTNVAS